MLASTILLLGFLASQNQIEPAHAQNSVYCQIIEQGLEAGGQKVALPRPRLFDGQDADAQRAALRDVVSSDRALDDLLRNSVTAPYKINVNDVKTSGATIRMADVWFVVYADLKQVDFGQEASRTDQKETEVANMWFQTRLMKDDDLRAAGIKPSDADPAQNRWYSHVHARLLDRIDFETTNQVVASQSPESIVIASRTDPAFAKVPTIANSWKPLARQGAAKTDEPARPYEGGMSYAKISRLALKPGAILVEMHMAFVEPDGWFQGAPILRSKFSAVAQDQIRSLRRELAKKRAK
jgi:hypothetical protein